MTSSEEIFPTKANRTARARESRGKKKHFDCILLWVFVPNQSWLLIGGSVPLKLRHPAALRGLSELASRSDNNVYIPPCFSLSCVFMWGNNSAVCVCVFSGVNRGFLDD